MDYLTWGAVGALVVVAVVFIGRMLKDNFSTGSDKLYVSKNTGARYNKPEQDLSEFR